MKGSRACAGRIMPPPTTYWVEHPSIDNPSGICKAIPGTVAPRQIVARKTNKKLARKEKWVSTAEECMKYGIRTCRQILGEIYNYPHTRECTMDMLLAHYCDLQSWHGAKNILEKVPFKQLRKEIKERTQEFYDSTHGDDCEWNCAKHMKAKL